MLPHIAYLQTFYTLSRYQQQTFSIERLNQLKALLDDPRRLSYKQIAGEMQLGKCAISGQVFRLKQAGGLSASTRSSPPKNEKGHRGPEDRRPNGSRTWQGTSKTSTTMLLAFGRARYPELQFLWRRCSTGQTLLRRTLRHGVCKSARSSRRRGLTRAQSPPHGSGWRFLLLY